MRLSTCFKADNRKDLYQAIRNLFNPIQDGGGGQKDSPLTSFSPVTSTNVGISSHNFLAFSFSPFGTLV